MKNNLFTRYTASQLYFETYEPGKLWDENGAEGCELTEKDRNRRKGKSTKPFQNTDSRRNRTPKRVTGEPRKKK